MLKFYTQNFLLKESFYCPKFIEIILLYYGGKPHLEYTLLMNDYDKFNF